MKPLEAIPIPSDAGAPRDWLAAAVWAMILSCLFMAVYAGCLWVTDRRDDVRTLFFDWEWGIPFVPWMIVPYVSIDLLFFAAPFLCRSERELAALVMRLTFVVCVAGACFLLFPLTMRLHRPEVEGFFGPWYETLAALDRPYNLAPSLHIAEWAVLWTVYGRHTRGLLRWAAFAWFALIAVSTLLTWQHHVIDVVTGQALGLLAIYLIRERGYDADAARDDEARVTRDLPMAARYAAVAAALAAAGYVLRPWGLLLWWPAVSLTVVALAYAHLGPGIFRKEDGRIDAATRFVLAPYLLGAWLTFPRYRRRAPAWGAVTEDVLVGRRVNDREAKSLIDQGVTAVLDLTAECGAPRPFKRLAYMNVPVLDLTVPTRRQFRAGVAFIRAQVRADGKVYVHCALGYSRSASIVATYLLAEGRAATAADAVAIVRSARPQILVGDPAIRAIEAFVKSEGSGGADALAPAASSASVSASAQPPRAPARG